MAYHESMEKAEDFKELSPNLYQTLQKAKTVKSKSIYLKMVENQ